MWEIGQQSEEELKGGRACAQAGPVLDLGKRYHLQPFPGTADRLGAFRFSPPPKYRDKV